MPGDTIREAETTGSQLIANPFTLRCQSALLSLLDG
jgi:hypothetical protein